MIMSIPKEAIAGAIAPYGTRFAINSDPGLGEKFEKPRELLFRETQHKSKVRTVAA